MSADRPGGPRGDPPGAIATEAAGWQAGWVGGGVVVRCGGCGMKKKKLTCDRAEHGSAAFMSQPLSNLGGRGKRKAEKV